MQIGIDKDAALYIYITILTDTGSFRYSNTTSKSHMIAAELVAKGLNPTAVYRRIYEGTRRSHLALLSSVLATLDISKDGKIAWIRITEDMLKRYRSDAETVQDFVNFPRSIKGVKIAMAFREAGSDIIKVSFRSNEGVDVCRLAKLFGGGGHTSASGCILKGTLAEAEEAALLKAKRYLANS
jgi:phosphoesterase RecJ-like protein